MDFDASSAGSDLGGGGGDDSKFLHETLAELYADSDEYNEMIKLLVLNYNNPQIVQQILNKMTAHNTDVERQNENRITSIQPQIDAIVQRYQMISVPIILSNLRPVFNEIDNAKQGIINALLTSVAQNNEQTDQLKYDLEKLDFIKGELYYIISEIRKIVASTPGNFITQIVHSQALAHLQQMNATIITFSKFNALISFSELFAILYQGNTRNYPNLFELLERFNAWLIKNPTITIMSKRNYLKLFEKWLNTYASFCVDKYAELLLQGQQLQGQQLQDFFNSNFDVTLNNVFASDAILYTVADVSTSKEVILQGLNLRFDEMNIAIGIVNEKIQKIVSKSSTASRAHKRNTKKQGQRVDQMYSLRQINDIFDLIKDDLVCRCAVIHAIVGPKTIEFAQSFGHPTYKEEFFHFYKQEEIKQFRDGVYDRIRELIMMSSNQEHAYDVVKFALSELAQSNIRETNKYTQLNTLMSNWKSMTTETVFGGVQDQAGSDNSNLKKYGLNVYVEIASSDELSSDGYNYYYDVNGKDHKISPENAFKLTITDLSKTMISMLGESFAEMAQPDPIPTLPELGGGGGGGGFGSYFGTGVEAVSSYLGAGVGAASSYLGSGVGAIGSYIPWGGGGGIPTANLESNPIITSTGDGGTGSSMVSGVGENRSKTHKIVHGKKAISKTAQVDIIKFVQPELNAQGNLDWTNVENQIKKILRNHSNKGHNKLIATKYIKRYEKYYRDDNDEEVKVPDFIHDAILQLKAYYTIDIIKKFNTKEKQTEIIHRMPKSQAEKDRLERFFDEFFKNIDNEIASVKEARRIRLIIEFEKYKTFEWPKEKLEGGKPPRKTKKRRNPKKSRKLMSRRQKYSRRK